VRNANPNLDFSGHPGRNWRS